MINRNEGAVVQAVRKKKNNVCMNERVQCSRLEGDDAAIIERNECQKTRLLSEARTVNDCVLSGNLFFDDRFSL